MHLILHHLWWFGLQADLEHSELRVHRVLTAYPNMARGNILFCWVFSVHSRRGWDEGCSRCCYVQSHCFVTLNAAHWTSPTLLYRTFTALTAQAFYHISCSSLSTTKGSSWTMFQPWEMWRFPGGVRLFRGLTMTFITESGSKERLKCLFLKSWIKLSNIFLNQRAFFGHFTLGPKETLCIVLISELGPLGLISRLEEHD